MTRKSTFSLLSYAVLMIGGSAHATSPNAWAAHYKALTSSCVEASGLGDAIHTSLQPALDSGCCGRNGAA